MKRIIFIRHAKAEEMTSEKMDFERSLTTKGKEVSRLMSKILKTKTENMGTMITSPAFRALETALIFAREYGLNPAEIILNNEIYDNFSDKSLKKILTSADNGTDTITLFGHNFSFTDLAASLSRDGCEEIPKTGIVSISFNVKSWEEIRQDTGKIDFFLKPKSVI